MEERSSAARSKSWVWYSAAAVDDVADVGATVVVGAAESIVEPAAVVVTRTRTGQHTDADASCYESISHHGAITPTTKPAPEAGTNGIVGCTGTRCRRPTGDHSGSAADHARHDDHDRPARHDGSGCREGDDH